MSIVVLRLFVRFFIGIILLSSGLSKFAHRSSFQKGIQDYHIISSTLDSRLYFSTILSFSIPIIECVVGIGLVTGFLLLPVTFLAIGLFLVFSGVLLANLLRGRTDLSCHCGGMMGEHRISWWLVIRNVCFIAGLLTLPLTSPDPLTLETLLYHPSLMSAAFLLNTVLPVIFVAASVLTALFILNIARTVLRPRS